MAIPSGSGTEVIKYTALDDLTNVYQPLITGVANHIYTVISIIYCDIGGDASGNTLRLTDSDGSSTPYYIFYGQETPSLGTFVWDNRFSFSGNKILNTSLVSSGNSDVICTYIDQDWT